MVGGCRADLISWVVIIMFDIINSTYSAVLSMLATLFGLSYPLIIGCIERIDEKYGSTKLSERFIKERSFTWFKSLLVSNLILAVVAPFLMGGCLFAGLIIFFQSALISLLIVFALLLFSTIITYYNPGELQQEILRDYKQAVNIKDRDKECLYFTQWIDLSGVLIRSVDDKLVQSVYETLSQYQERVFNESDRKGIFDQYYYEGVSRINELLCREELKPISVNNSNSVLTSLLQIDSIISDTTYRYLWSNLRVQLFYRKDEWIMEYWKFACQKMQYCMKPIFEYSCDVEGRQYTSSQVEDNRRQRRDFLEFHIMLCAMLLQQGRYELLGMMLSYTQSIPETYPLVPSTFSEIFNEFNRVYLVSSNEPLYYELHYPMPNMHGITGGKIVEAANCYLAFLVCRLYVIDWHFGSEHVLELDPLPDTLAELKVMKDNFAVFRGWIQKISGDKELMNVIRFRSFDKEISGKKTQDDDESLRSPLDIISDIQKKIDCKMETLRSRADFDRERVEAEKTALCDNVGRFMSLYEDFLNSNLSQTTDYNLNSSVSMPFPNTAFVQKPDVSYTGIADVMSSYMLDNFQHLFASVFYREHSNNDYQVSSDQLFETIDKLVLNDEHLIIGFGVYFDYYIGRVDGLIKETDNKFKYKGVQILSLGCNTKYFSQIIYVMHYNDRPSLKFNNPSEEERSKFYIKEFNKEFNIWLSLEKFSEYEDLLNDSLKSQLGNKSSQYSLFTVIWKPKLLFSTKCNSMISIKVKYRLWDEGVYDDVGEVKPYPN